MRVVIEGKEYEVEEVWVERRADGIVLRGDPAYTGVFLKAVPKTQVIGGIRWKVGEARLLREGEWGLYSQRRYPEPAVDTPVLASPGAWLDEVLPILTPVEVVDSERSRRGGA